MRSTLVGRLNTDNSLVGAGNTITGHSQLVGTFGNRGIVAGEVGTAYNPTYAIVTEAGAQITLYINSSNYQFYAELKDKNGNHIANSNIIDLPLESMVVDGSYDADTKEVVLTLDNGNEVRFSVADLVEGLVSTEQLNTILNDYVQFTDYASTSTAGVFKSADSYGVAVNSNGQLYAQTKSYSQYGSLGNNLFIGKGTLENVIAGKGLISNTDYATTDTGGVIKYSNSYGSAITSDGILRAYTKSYSTYQTSNDNMFISKGTLENVITGKDLTTKAYVDGLVGDIQTLLDTLNTGNGV